MTTSLAARAADAPLPVGVSYKKPGGGGQTVAWPPAENFIYPGTGVGGDTMAFNRPERFWLRAGAILSAVGPASWARYDYELRLVVNGNYGNDLNGINFFQKANACGGGTQGWGTSIESLWFCEANTSYIVYLLSKGGDGQGVTYYQSQYSWALWAYTIGEGVY